jgi:hypothetical protein
MPDQSESPPTIPADVGRRAMERLQQASAYFEREFYLVGPQEALDIKHELRAAITELKQYLSAQEQGEKERI